MLVAVIAVAAPPTTEAPKDAAPDIWIKHIKLAGSDFAPGALMRVALTVENRGTAVAPAGYRIDISLGTAPATFPASTHTVPFPYRFVNGMLLKSGRLSGTGLAPGASTVLAEDVTLPTEIKAGRYWVQLSADSTNALREPQPHPRGEHDNVTNTDINIVR